MERNVNCMNSRVIIEFVKREYPGLMETLLDDLDPFFETLDSAEEYLLDEHNWISQNVCVKLFERVRLFSGNPDIARYIGRESVINRRFGYVENIFIKSIGNPHLSILRAPYINAKLNKTKAVEIISADKTHAVIRLNWFKDIGSTKDICLFNKGVYEAIPAIWGLPMAKVNEHKCYFDGDEYCEYAFEWTSKPFWDKISGLFFRKQDVLKESIAELEKEKAHVARKYEEVESLNKELENRVDRLLSLNACSKATTSILDADVLLNEVMSLIVNIMHFDRAVLMLVDHDKRVLKPVKGVGGGSENDIEKIKGYRIPLDHTSNILARVVDSGIAQIVTDVDKSFLRKENIILKMFNPKSFAAFPLINRNKVTGVLAAERLKGLNDFSSNDTEFMMNFCNQIAISLENAKLIDYMKQSFVSSILSLASALEAKDSYTRGHSNRVATYSTIVARKLGLEEESVESIRLMALMHDIGKIGVSDNTLNKPGKLSDKEFDNVKQHPELGVRIIEPLLQNKSELRYVRSHHERYDGKGYPDGLKGDSIPLEARIMAVADCYDAMTSQRSYRTALSKEYALSEIEKNKGTQFCPQITDLFIESISSMSDDLYYLITCENNSPPVLHK
ncbi:HD domain-containing phosphohydrolase [Candidatus Latescibacterota bacterium]